MNKNLRAQFWGLISGTLLAIYGAVHLVIDIIGWIKDAIKMIQNYYG